MVSLPLLRRHCLCALLGAIFSAIPNNAGAAEVLDGKDSHLAAEIDSDMARAMTTLHVPGAAVGVIKDGKVILAKGYGVREVGKPASVDAGTLFDIASMTKSFTATAVAAMVDDGKLGWDTPVITYLPWFRMYDAIATELITPRDLLAHRSGMPRHDFLRMSTYLSRRELVDRIRYLPSNRTFREGFQYNNLMYTVAGYLAGQVNGTTWEELVKQRIFIPLGMTRSSTSAVELQQSDNFAHPHSFEKGKIITIPVYDYQKFGVGPNGAVNSSVDDMLKYLEFHLTDGKAGGQQVISARQMKQLHTPVTALSTRLAEYTGDDTYALGWMCGHHDNHLVLEHSGAIDGFTSDMILVPDRRIGIVVLNNLASSLLPDVIAHDLMDRVLGVQPKDYLDKIVTRVASEEKILEAEKAKFEAGRIKGAKPTLPLLAYTGTYFHPAYGNVRVALDGDNLKVNFDAQSLSLKHYNFDTFSYETEIAQFLVGASGKVTEMHLPLEPTVKPFVFVRQEK